MEMANPIPSTQAVIDPATIAERNGLLQRADMPVQTQEQYQEAAGVLAALTSIKNRIEALRKAMVAPIEASKRNIDAMFKAESSPVELAVNTLRSRMSHYDGVQQEAARKEQERLNRLAEQRRDRAEAKGITPTFPVATPAKVALPEMKVQTATGATVSMTTIWDFEVVDEQSVPREFWVLDLVAIRKQVKAGRHEIPGVRVFSTRVPSARGA
jgi:hypothetical protein